MDEATPPHRTSPAAGAEEDHGEHRWDPAKIIRLGTMVDTLLREVRQMSPDQPARERLAQIHMATMAELAEVLPDDLRSELEEFTNCCSDNPAPSTAELRIAQAQLVGWLQGLLQGFQASAMAQQATAARTAEQLSGRPQGPSPGLPHQTGTYL